MNKVLVYIKEGDLAPKGGALGYNYHLHQQLVAMGATNISYLPGSSSLKARANGLIQGIKNKKIKYVLTVVKSILNKTKQLYGNKRACVDLSQYDVVHFHRPFDMFMCRDSLKTYTGKVVLTSHAPTLSSLQIIDMLTDWEKKYMMWLYKKFLTTDEYAFMRADYIFFPCPEAEEPYYNNWDKYSDIKNAKADCYRYILTGTEKRRATISREEVCKIYGIPQNAFIVCYAGRHNEIKGYDALKRFGEQILAKYSNVYFLVAGKEEPLTGLDHDRWIEVGWTNDPHSLIKASDLFMLPNKETYFDLILLEVLSLGKVVLASHTGGNRYFENNPGVLTYKSDLEALSIFEKIYKMSSEEKKTLEFDNEKLFDATFSLPVFAKNYLDLIDSL